MRVRTQHFSKTSSQAIGDQQIQRSLVSVAKQFDHARQEAIQELTPEVWERYRERGSQIFYPCRQLPINLYSLFLEITQFTVITIYQLDKQSTAVGRTVADYIA